jgi:type IV pilus assembly protein PilN
MPYINLLAWREASRKEAQKQFISILLLVVLISFGSMLILSMFYASLKEGQNVRNGFLTSEISLLDRRIKDIRELDKRKASLKQRMLLIEELQSNRNLGTQIMNELVLIIPSGIYLTSLERRDRTIVVIGKTESNNRVSAMYIELEKSRLFEKIGVDFIAGEGERNILNDFEIDFQVKPYSELSEGKQ